MKHCKKQDVNYSISKLSKEQKMITKITKHILKTNQFEIFYDKYLDIYSNNEFVLKSKFCTLSTYFNKNRIINTRYKKFEAYFNLKNIDSLNGNVSNSYFVQINKIPMQVIEFEGKNFEIYISKTYYRYLSELRPSVYINTDNTKEPIRLVIDNEIIGLIMPRNIENIDKYDNENFV